MNCKLSVTLLFLFLLGCTHPVEITGQGDILSATGKHNCPLENQPCKFLIAGEYVETYTPTPRPNHEFVAWEGCNVPTGNCSFNVPADLVFKFWGKTAPPLRAKFAPICTDAPADSFTAIQQQIFNGKGCASGNCHSNGNRAAGMSLASGSSYASIVGAGASSSELNRIEPGSADNSYLYRKVAVRTVPGSFTITGRGMPLSGSALSENELAALAAWINAGAPQTGRVGELKEVEQLLGLCD